MTGKNHPWPSYSPLVLWALQSQTPSLKESSVFSTSFSPSRSMIRPNMDYRSISTLPRSSSIRGHQWPQCLFSIHFTQFSCSVVFDSLWPHEQQHTRPPCLSQLPESPQPMSIESVMPSNHLILCHPLLLLSSIFPSIRVFSNESALCIRWQKYWSFSFNISPTNEHPGLISFRMDWLDLLAVQGTLKSFLQHHSSKASILRCSAFFIVQLSHPYMTTGKTIALTRRTFVDKVMSLLFNMLSRLVISLSGSQMGTVLSPGDIEQCLELSGWGEGPLHLVGRGQGCC